ncbi:phage tail protein [Photobacterium indicum]|uniref:Phage tail protein n=1 Tax=Photobacterium indicum TaxID=81447 RepID=A0A2T3LAG2_9GAMM|nr:phage tail protein [Photobacterium indicum]PSV48319.1 phage tail protein [Photobacterium indicum]
MAVSLPNGVVFAIAKTKAAPAVMSALTNAADAVATVTGNTIATNDIVIVQSGWSNINEQIAKVGATSKLLGFDTSDTTKFPTDSGIGKLIKVSDWQQITQVISSETSGGDQQFATYSFLENDFETQIPTRTSPVVLTLSIADDDTLPGYIALKKAADGKETQVVRATLPNGATLYYHAYISVNETPSMTKDQVMAIGVTISLIVRPTRYTKA